MVSTIAYLNKVGRVTDLYWLLSRLCHGTGTSNPPESLVKQPLVHKQFNRLVHATYPLHFYYSIEQHPGSKLHATNIKTNLLTELASREWVREKVLVEAGEWQSRIGMVSCVCGFMKINTPAIIPLLCLASASTVSCTVH